MPANELSSAVEESRFPGFNGQARKVPLDILRKLLRGGITIFRLQADCLHHDGVEIAAQATRQLFGSKGTCFSNQLRGDEGSRAVIGRYFFVDSVDGHTRLLRFLRVTALLHLESRIVTNPMRSMPGQQFIKQDSERIDIRRLGDRCSAHLFWTRIFGRHRTPTATGKRGFRGPLRVEHLGNAKIQQPDHALLGNQNVAGLQITMDDQVLMGILHREADSTEQLQACGDRQSVSVAIFVDANALDVLHDQIGQAFFGAATIKELYDAGVVQCCQGLPLVAKTAQDFILIRTRLQHFDGYTLAILFIRTFSQINDRHAATPNLAQDAVRANPFSRHGERLRG